MALAESVTQKFASLSEELEGKLGDSFINKLITKESLKKIHALLRKFDENEIPQSTNNRLKGHKEYDTIVEAANKVRPLFEKRNRLDLELYSYAKQKFGSP